MSETAMRLLNIAITVGCNLAFYFWGRHDGLREGIRHMMHVQVRMALDRMKEATSDGEGE